MRTENPFYSDYYRLRGDNKSNFRLFVDIVFRQNVRFMLYYRNYQRSRFKATKLIYRFLLYIMSRKYGLEFSTNAKIGEGIYLCHPYNITVGNGVVIGKNCTLYKGCTLGVDYRGSRQGAPTLGDCVFVGINASVIGKVKIGEDVLIAPNSYVNFDVPSHSVVIGNPGRIFSRNGATDECVFNLIP